MKHRGHTKLVIIGVTLITLTLVGIAAVYVLQRPKQYVTAANTCVNALWEADKTAYNSCADQLENENDARIRATLLHGIFDDKPKFKAARIDGDTAIVHYRVSMSYLNKPRYVLVLTLRESGGTWRMMGMGMRDDPAGEGASFNRNDYVDAVGLQNVMGYSIPYMVTDTTILDTFRKKSIDLLAQELGIVREILGHVPTFDELNETIVFGAPEDFYVFADPESQPAYAQHGLSMSPTPNAYSYQPTGEGEVSCDNSTVMCEHYTLTATLSDGMPYSKQD